MSSDILNRIRLISIFLFEPARMYFVTLRKPAVNTYIGEVRLAGYVKKFKRIDIQVFKHTVD